MKKLIYLAAALSLLMPVRSLFAKNVYIRLPVPVIKNADRKLFANPDESLLSENVGDLYAQTEDKWEDDNPDKEFICSSPNYRFQMESGKSEVIGIWIHYRDKINFDSEAIAKGKKVAEKKI